MQGFIRILLYFGLFKGDRSMYDKKKRDRLSKFMSYILPHNPAEYGVTLDTDGFVSLDEFTRAIQQEINGRMLV
jgi:RNA:NAD 2'-phosphotransferase (TPT1/KptA family)